MGDLMLHRIPTKTTIDVGKVVEIENRISPLEMTLAQHQVPSIRRDENTEISSTLARKHIWTCLLSTGQGHL